jgi:uncharacterized protein YbjT (DUF2867 family)
MKVVIPGGSGQVGTILARHFHQQGHSVTVLSRSPRPVPWRVARWDAETEGPWVEAWTVAITWRIDARCTTRALFRPGCSTM